VPGMYGHAFRTHSIGRVLEELTVHKDNVYTFFADDIFTANKKRVKELLRGMIDRGLTPPWGAQVRTETVDDVELLQLMRDSNCFNVYVGFESINPRTLKLFQKKQDLAKIERSIERFHAHKIRIHGMFVVGSDEDDVETLDATADFALRHDIDSIQFMILTPIPGSSPSYGPMYPGSEHGTDRPGGADSLVVIGCREHGWVPRPGSVPDRLAVVGDVPGDGCRGRPAPREERGGDHQGGGERAVPSHGASWGQGRVTTSPLARVPIARHVVRSMPSATNRTEPSARATFTPPVCRLRAPA